MNLQPLTHDWTRQDNTRTGSHSMEPVPCCTMAFLCKVRQDLGSQSREPVTPSKAAGICRALQTLVTQALESEPLVPQVVLSGQSSQRKPSQGCCAPTFHGWHPQGQKDPVESGKGTCFPFLSWPPSGQRVPGEICWGSYSSLVHRWSPQDNTGPRLSGQGSSAS